MEFDGIYSFEAGQFVSIRVSPEGERRSYSIANKPGENEIELLVDVSPMGVGSKFMLGLEEGEEVEMLGPLGGFVVGGVEVRQLFIGTGCGIVPLRSMVLDLLENKKSTKEIRLFWGLRHEEDVFYWKDEFEKLEKEHRNFKFLLTLSQGGEKWRDKKGYVTEWVEKEIADFSDWEVYICGSMEVMKDISGKLVTGGVKEERIYSERFF